ncbi:MAG: cobyrinate a,c-diamide synthase [Desulfarculaceae bacterium]|nr:cobyrinate a,c-diamide synthase [Desulfarculaceae bacterium]MCF8071333.1 cobyrinate a,c-diamide synthase [Desulfarculaceae bacterium]MCF8101658.1 cobyrinate a,c-diamide synthase [Desulfarculaceae bacterium]MCF8116733.1 cobyrinate a,c-diamide synthase [Desulfarculaceae bacterium]
MKGICIAGVSSGVGKTTVTLALLAALARRGLDARPFKAGPDFIDPGHHALACGRVSHNLDTWMLSPAENRAVFARHAAGGQVAVLEGAMGLFDGSAPENEQGSTAQLAKLLGLPVLLVADAGAMARSLAALALGFARFDPQVRFAGLAANNLAGEGHRDLARRAMASAPSMPWSGGLLRRPKGGLAERHLGLVIAEEAGLGPADLAALADWLEEGLDLDALVEGLPELELAPPSPAGTPGGPPVRLGVARDRAFCFYYPENLRRLEAAGAELVFFSPLADPDLPPNLGGLYVGGGYPELAAETLAANRSLASQIADAGRAGLPIYAECGGMMYLGQELEDLQGRAWPMAGLLPIRTRMLPRLASLGYRALRFKQDTILGPAGAEARGHEFHYSEVVEGGPGQGGLSEAYLVEGPSGRGQPWGLKQGNTLASYLHLHFGSNPDLARRLVASARKWLS